MEKLGLGRGLEAIGHGKGLMLASIQSATEDQDCNMGDLVRENIMGDLVRENTMGDLEGDH